MDAFFGAPVNVGIAVQLALTARDEAGGASVASQRAELRELLEAKLDAGLPEGEIPLALLSFNLGIEAGQVVFVVGVLALLRMLRVVRLPEQLPAWTAMVPVYVMGSFAAMWCIERMLALFRRLVPGQLPPAKCSWPAQAISPPPMAHPRLMPVRPRRRAFAAEPASSHPTRLAPQTA